MNIPGPRREGDSPSSDFHFYVQALKGFQLPQALRQWEESRVCFELQAPQEG